MNKLCIGMEAPDFEKDDFNRIKIHLNSYRKLKNILLVFNRGFL